MITGIWMDEENGATRLIVQIDDDELVCVDFSTDPPMSSPDDLPVPRLDHTWIEMSPECDKEHAG